jgi:hypothetical protein
MQGEVTIPNTDTSVNINITMRTGQLAMTQHTVYMHLHIHRRVHKHIYKILTAIMSSLFSFEFVRIYQR